MLKVLFVSPSPYPSGGIGNWVYLMKNALNTSDTIHLTRIINQSKARRAVDGRTLFERVVVSGFEMFEKNREFVKAIETDRPDVVHMTTSGSLATIRDIMMLRTAKRLGVPVVYHLHFGRVPEIEKRDTWEWKQICKAITLSARTIAIDGNSYKTLFSHFSSKIVYVPNPFDCSALDGIEHVEAKKIVVFIGWGIKTKGLEELLSAWQHIHHSYADWVLKLVGPINEQYKTELESRFPMDQVTIAGEKSHKDVLGEINAASIFILPSYTEGFPNSVLEAMALGKPIIATAVGAIPEMLQENSGILIPPRNVDAIASALKRLIPDTMLQKTLGSNAKKRLMANYTMDIVLSQYEYVWRNAIRTV